MKHRYIIIAEVNNQKFVSKPISLLNAKVILKNLRKNKAKKIKLTKIIK